MSINDNDDGYLNVVQILVLPFAGAKDLLIAIDESTDNNNDSVSFKISLKNHWRNGLELRTFLCEQQWPQLKLIMPTLMLALNHKYLPLNESVSLQSGDILALIPPISGG